MCVRPSGGDRRVVRLCTVVGGELCGRYGPRGGRLKRVDGGPMEMGL